MEVAAIVDSGAATSLISEKAAMGLKRTVLKNTRTMVTANGARGTITEKVTANFENVGRVELLVAPLREELPIVLGYDWIKQSGAVFTKDDAVRFTAKDGKKKIMLSTSSPRKMKEEVASQIVSLKRLKKMSRKKLIEEVYEITIFGKEVETEVSSTDEVGDGSKELFLKNIDDLLKEYPAVFPKEAVLTGLPKERNELSQPAMAIDTGNAAPC